MAAKLLKHGLGIGFGHRDRNAPQSIFGPLALGDVGRDAADCVDLAVVVEQRKSGGEEHLPPLRHLNDLLELQRRARAQDLSIVAAKYLRNRIGQQLIQAVADDTLLRQAEKFAATLVGEQVAAIRILDEHRGGAVVEQLPQSRIASGKDVDAVYPIGRFDAAALDGVRGIKGGWSRAEGGCWMVGAHGLLWSLLPRLSLAA